MSEELKIPTAVEVERWKYYIFRDMHDELKEALEPYDLAVVKPIFHDLQALNFTPILHSLIGDRICIRLKMIKFLIDLGTNVDQRDQDGSSVLMQAIRFHQLGISKLLIAKGADIRLRNDKGETPLSWCEDYQDRHIKKLIEKIITEESTENNVNETQDEIFLFSFKPPSATHKHFQAHIVSVAY
jgi:ankyrin repeat protein